MPLDVSGGPPSGLAGPGPGVLAIDVGGTDTKAAVIDRAGNLHGLERIPSAHDERRPGDAVAEQVVELARTYTARFPDREIHALGLVVPGLVDDVAGVGLFASNFGWDHYPFRDVVSDATGLPVAFGHDVSAAGDAEMRAGAGLGAEDAVVLIIGTGIAGAVFCGGRPVRAGGYAGEIGHAQVPGGLPCPCGATGCLETLGSAGAIMRRYTARTGRPVSGAREVLIASQAGDEDASEIWADAVQALAFSICQLAAMIGTETVILGGGLSQAGPALLEPLGRRIQEQMTFLRVPRLTTSLLGQDAGLIGAALHARDLLQAHA
ncbi:ROK family protein [Arthrobacter sp. MDT1-65]